MDDAKDKIEGTVEGSSLGQSYKISATGTWVPVAVLGTVASALLIYGDQAHVGKQLALYLVLVALGVTLGVAFTSKRVEDWRGIAEERKREIDRMADEKNGLVEIRKRRSSTKDKK